MKHRLRIGLAVTPSLLLNALLLAGCEGPFPTIGPLSADSDRGHVTAQVEPGETTVTRIEAEFGTRPSFNHPAAPFWRSLNILLLEPGSGSSQIPLPTRATFRAKFMIGRDFPLFDGQVVDVQFKVFYRRPNSSDELAYWSERKAFVAGGQLGPTNLCVFRYRRSTGPLESEPNMPEEQATAHPFTVPRLGESPAPGEFRFQSGSEHAGQVRESFGECLDERPCFGVHARELKNVGRNRLHVTLVGPRFEHLEPGDAVNVREDIASISCERSIDEQAVLDALCRAAPEEPGCANR